MIFKSGSGSSWYLDLADESELKKELPMNNLVVKNNSGYTIDIFINDILEMVIESKNTDTKIGKNFRTLTLVSEGSFSDNEIIMDVGKNVQTTLTPYNPGWDALQIDFSKYASGCDNRISSSSIVDVPVIEHVLNTNKLLSVLNRLDLKGSESLGDYDITLNDDTHLKGSVPLNGTILDTKKYSWNNSQGIFDVITTNCTLSGIIIDYKGINDITDSSTIIISDTNAYDNSFETSTENSIYGNASKTLFECIFNETLIENLYTIFSIKSDIFISYMDIYYKNSSNDWILIQTVSNNTSSYVRFIKNHSIGVNCKGIKFILRSTNGAATSYGKIYDITIN